VAVEIRPMTIADYDQVYALWQACEGVGLSAADEPQAIRAYLERNPGLSAVALDGGRVVGTVLCGHDGRRGYIHHLAVAQSHRRRGIGRALVERILSALMAQGIQKCHLFVFGENRQAIAFWERVGFSQRVELVMMSRQIADG